MSLDPERLLKRLHEHAQRARAAPKPVVPSGVVAPRNLFAENLQDVTEASIHNRSEIDQLHEDVKDLKSELERRQGSTQEAFEDRRFMIRVLAGSFAVMALLLVIVIVGLGIVILSGG